MAEHVQLYETTYRNFELSAREQVRLETYGEDIGQNGWLTTDEWRAALTRLALGPGSRVLDVACGSGGPDLHLARTTGAHVVGVDVNAQAVETATERARREDMASLVRFEQADAARPLPFEDATFDAVLCIDAVNHLPGRLHVLRDWHRLLKPGGHILFTDPVVVTGLLSSEEIALRASIGFFVFSLRDEDERLIQEAGFDLLRCDNSTDSVVRVARRWRDARARHRHELIEDEGATTFEGMQRFLSVVNALAEQRRLSRYTFLARCSNHSIRSAQASSASRCGASSSETPARISTSAPWNAFAISVASAGAGSGSSSPCSAAQRSATSPTNVRHPAIASRQRRASSSSARPAAQSSQSTRA